MTDDLMTWLRAALDEDEQDARRRDFHTGMCLTFLDPGGDCTCDYSARVLAEVEAKRRILDLYEELYEPGLYEAVALLALPCADRPGYQEAWRP